MFLVGACLLWVLLSFVIAEICLRLMLFFSVVICWAKSPYDPRDEADRKRLCIVLAIPVGGGGEGGIKMGSIGEVVSSAAASTACALVYAVRAIFDVIFLRFAFMSLDAVDLDLPVPYILATVPDVAVDLTPLTKLMYDVTGLTTELFQAILRAIFSGVPRCEGPALVVSSIWLIVISLVLIRWLNYDYFGVFTATKHGIMATRPTFQRSMGCGLVLVVQVAMFLMMQCIMLLFGRAVSLMNVNPMAADNDRWMCPYEDEQLAIIIGRIFLLFAVVISLSILFVTANGHVFGRRYITKDFQKRVSMDLSGLDPDLEECYVCGKPYEGDEENCLECGKKKEAGSGLLRFDAFLSMIPTTLGIWIDGWNVKGFLIKERATIYADQLGHPDICPHCGVAHVPYWEIMRVTGMQLSLSYQMLPFGAIVGKACEYLNNPPLLYLGSNLCCYNATMHVRAAKAGMPKKMGCGLVCMKFYLGLFCAGCRDLLIPLLTRIAGLGTYILLVWYTFTINKDNYEQKGQEMFQILFTVCTAKSTLDFFLPALAVAGLATALVWTARRKQAAKEEGFRRWAPLIGQIAHGVTPGIAVAIFLTRRQKELGFNVDGAVFVGTAVGISLGLFQTGLGLACELCPNSRISTSLLCAVLNAIAAVGISTLVGDNLGLPMRIMIAALVLILLMLTTGFCFRPPPILDKVTKARAPSSILPILGSARALSGPIGTIAGTFLGGLPHEMLIDFFGEYQGLVFAIGFGISVGGVFGLAADAIVETKPGQWALLVGTATTLLLGLLVHWIVGAVVGSIVGSFAGSYQEHLIMKQVLRTSMEPHINARSRVQGPSILDPKTDLVAQPGQVAVIHGRPPTGSVTKVDWDQNEYNPGDPYKNNKLLAGELADAATGEPSPKSASSVPTLEALQDQPQQDQLPDQPPEPESQLMVLPGTAQQAPSGSPEQSAALALLAGTGQFTPTAPLSPTSQQTGEEGQTVSKRRKKKFAVGLQSIHTTPTTAMLNQTQSSDRFQAWSER
jgi:hypothetical protein